ncbi:MAG: diaminopimelate decarboxylase, partial [Gammaproteobacteria bacterium]|nr:diaminopimelate decarboxylase [Gammaproteobacteria bacterium]
MGAHEAGELHAGHRAPSWLRKPDDANALVPRLWPRTVRRDEDGTLRVGGVRVDEIAREFGTPAYVMDEDDFRARLRAFRDAFAAAFGGSADVYYGAKAFLTVAAARWVAEEGVGLDVCTGGELGVALRAGFPPQRMLLHGNNKSTSELARAVDAGVGLIVLDSGQEIDRLAALAAGRGVRVP